MPAAQAQNDASEHRASNGVIHFQIPAEPLDQALDAYEHAAGIGVLIDGNLLDGRIGAPLNGDYPPHDALQSLLEGTGLRADFTAADAAVVVLSPTPMLPPQASGSIPSQSITAADIDGVDGYAAYATLVQNRLTAALCRTLQTEPGSYRLVVQLLINNSGSVMDSKVIGSADPQRKAAVTRIVRSLVLGEAPPAGLQQPVTILLRPLGNGVVPDCPQPDGHS